MHYTYIYVCVYEEAGMHYDCADDYIVCGAAGYYNKWLESWIRVYKVQFDS